MSSVRAYRSALLTLSLCVLAITSCRTASEPTPNETAATGTVVSTTPPFQTKEPERYQATRTITIFTPDGETIVTKTLIARDGPLRREASDTVVYLETAEGRLVLLPNDKVYAVATADDNEPTEAGETSPDRLLHTDPISTTYQALGSETIGGRTAAKYRIVVNIPAPGNVSLNETLMWIDDALNMPVRSETTSPDGTRAVMELSAIALDPDKQLFQIPAGYEKIGFTVLQKQLRGAQVNPSVR